MFTFSNISVLELKKLVSVIIISSICRWLTRTRGTAVLIGFSLQKSGSKLYITRYVTKLSVCSAIVLGVLKSLFSKGLPHINNSLFCVSTVPPVTYKKKYGCFDFKPYEYVICRLVNFAYLIYSYQY